jgi:uncharacterized protein YqjF (DUF2071 family)
MVWHDLLFMHWPIDPAEMRKVVPQQFELDLHDGQAWLGVVPFRMSGVRPRCMPTLPRFAGRTSPSCFLELNVRTYVNVCGKRGVLFFSLDAENKLAVRVARRFFHLPYFDARMNCKLDGKWLHYESRRTHKDAPPATLSMRYCPDRQSRAQPSSAGTLEHFLTERYCLFTLNRKGRVLCGEIHHQPWPLQTAEVEIREIDMTKALGLNLVAEPSVLHFAKRLDVVAWRNKRL